MAGAPAATERPSTQLAVLAALPFELAGLREVCAFGVVTYGQGFRTWRTLIAGVSVLIVETGMGQARASRAAHAVIDAFGPAFVLSIGFCGGLNPDVRSGEVVLGRSVKRVAGRAITCSRTLAKEELASRMGAQLLQVVTVDAAVTTAQGKAALFASSKGDVVDMESFAVVDVCQQRQTKFGVLRVVSDEAGEDLPSGVMTLVGESGALRLGALVGTLWRKPSSVVELWKLKQKSHVCSQKLARALVALCESIGSRVGGDKSSANV